jgi:hypothetical protein
MDHGDDYKRSADRDRSDEPARVEGKKGSKRIATVTKTVRAVTAVVVFGIPLAAGTVTLLGYGIYQAYKRITSRS